MLPLIVADSQNDKKNAYLNGQLFVAYGQKLQMAWKK